MSGLLTTALAGGRPAIGLGVSLSPSFLLLLSEESKDDARHQGIYNLLKV